MTAEPVRDYNKKLYDVVTYSKEDGQIKRVIQRAIPGKGDEPWKIADDYRPHLSEGQRVAVIDNPSDDTMRVLLTDYEWNSVTKTLDKV